MLGLMKKIVSFHCAFFISIDKIHSTKENIKYKIGIKLIYHSFSNYLMESWACFHEHILYPNRLEITMHNLEHIVFLIYSKFLVINTSEDFVSHSTWQYSIYHFFSNWQILLSNIRWNLVQFYFSYGSFIQIDRSSFSFIPQAKRWKCCDIVSERLLNSTFFSLRISK